MLVRTNKWKNTSSFLQTLCSLNYTVCTLMIPSSTSQLCHISLKKQECLIFSLRGPKLLMPASTWGNVSNQLFKWRWAFLPWTNNSTNMMRKYNNDLKKGRIHRSFKIACNWFTEESGEVKNWYFAIRKYIPSLSLWILSVWFFVCSTLLLIFKDMLFIFFLFSQQYLSKCRIFYFYQVQFINSISLVIQGYPSNLFILQWALVVSIFQEICLFHINH